MDRQWSIIDFRKWYIGRDSFGVLYQVEGRKVEGFLHTTHDFKATFNVSQLQGDSNYNKVQCKKTLFYQGNCIEALSDFPKIWLIDFFL